MLNKMEPNIEPCSTPVINVFEKHSQCHSFLHLVFFIFSMNKQNLLHPLINYMHEVLQQINHEDYSQKPWRDP